jgi:hypothetical protein
MQVNYLILIFTGIYLLASSLYYSHAKRKGIVFRYKPVTLIIVTVLFGLSLFGLLTGKAYSEILPFIR